MPKTMMTIMMMMMMIMTDPFTTNLVVKGSVVKGSVVKGAHPVELACNVCHYNCHIKWPLEAECHTTEQSFGKLNFFQAKFL